MRAADFKIVGLVEMVRGLEYGRPSDRSVEAMLDEGRGTCSAKHLFLARRLSEDCPECEPRLFHRVYRVDRERARRDFGERAAAVVPPEGLVDVHRYMTIEMNGRRTIIDATFPGRRGMGFRTCRWRVDPASTIRAKGMQIRRSGSSRVATAIRFSESDSSKRFRRAGRDRGGNRLRRVGLPSSVARGCSTPN